MSIEQITAEALRLSPRERATLAESLWESLPDSSELPLAMDEETTLKLADERDREVESGEVKALGHPELIRQLRQ